MKKFKVNNTIIYASSLKDAVKKYKMSTKDRAIHEEHGVCDIWMNSTNKAYAIGGIRHFNKKWNESGLREYAKEVLESADFIKKLEAQGYRLDTDKAYRDSVKDSSQTDIFDSKNWYSVHWYEKHKDGSTERGSSQVYANSNSEAEAIVRKSNPNIKIIASLVQHNKTDDTSDDELDDLSDEERQAIEDYRTAIQNTTNPKLLELYAHILQEETEHLKELESAKANDSVKDMPLAVKSNTSPSVLRANMKNFLSDPDKYWTPLNSNLEAIISDIFEWDHYKSEGLFETYPNLKANAKAIADEYYKILDAVAYKSFDNHTYMTAVQKILKVRAMLNMAKKVTLE